MLLQEQNQEAFKRWVLPKLETMYVSWSYHSFIPVTCLNSNKASSDADAEVLADYVIALVVANDSEANIKRNCLDSLSDFLQDSM